MITAVHLQWASGLISIYEYCYWLDITFITFRGIQDDNQDWLTVKENNLDKDDLMQDESDEEVVSNLFWKILTGDTLKCKQYSLLRIF